LQKFLALLRVPASPGRLLLEGGIIVGTLLAVDGGLGDALQVTDIALITLLPVLWAASRLPMPIALVSAGALAIAVNYFYFPPVHSFGFQSRSDAITFVIYIAVAAILGIWVARFRRQLDVTTEQIGIIEQARAREAEAAAEKDRLKSSLLSSVSHDLRTPITSILGSVGTILDTSAAPSADRLRTLHLNIQESAEVLARQVDNILAITKLDVGVKPRFSWVDLKDVVGSALSRFSEIDRRMVAVDVADYLPPVRLDFVMMETIVANLLDNALKFRDPHSLISLRAWRQDESAVLEVRNSGPVVGHGDLARIFERFGRADAGRTVPGSGLGLSICRGFAEAMGGSIVAMAAANPAGMTFQATFPIKRETAA
jgi:K+-sensing histidine kinase KdpD